MYCYSHFDGIKSILAFFTILLLKGCTVTCLQNAIIDGTIRKEYPEATFYNKFPGISSYNFENTVKHSGAYGSIVFFGATWCKHSRVFNSTYKLLHDIVKAGEFGSYPNFYYYDVPDPKVDILHKTLRVRGFPTVIYFKDDAYWTFSGDRDLPKLQIWLRDVISGDGKEGTPYPKDSKEPTTRADPFHSR